MADTFRLDFVGTKAGIKGASVVMGYLETGMRVLDAASSLLSRLQELAVLGGNATNTTADHEAINAEAEAIADEFNRLMSTSKYKGKDMFVTTAGSEYVSLGGRDAEMTFGIGTIDYSALWASTARTIAGGPNDRAVTKSARNENFSFRAVFSASSQTIVTLSETLRALTASNKKSALFSFRSISTNSHSLSSSIKTKAGTPPPDPRSYIFPF